MEELMEEKKPSLTEMTLKEHRFVKKLKLKNEKEFVRNPYTGNGVNLTPLQVAIYDYIKGAEALGNHGQDFRCFKNIGPKSIWFCWINNIFKIKIIHRERNKNENNVL